MIFFVVFHLTNNILYSYQHWKNECKYTINCLCHQLKINTFLLVERNEVEKFYNFFIEVLKRSYEERAEDVFSISKNQPCCPVAFIINTYNGQMSVIFQAHFFAVKNVRNLWKKISTTSMLHSQTSMNTDILLCFEPKLIWAERLNVIETQTHTKTENIWSLNHVNKI